MKYGRVILGAGLLAAIALFTLRGCNEMPASAPSVRPRTAPPIATVPRSTTPRDAPASVASESAPSADATDICASKTASAPVILEVTVLRSDGAPAQGAVVRVFEHDVAGGDPMGGIKPRDLPPLRGRAVTDRDGRARLEVADALWGGFVAAQLGEDAAISQEPVYLKGGSQHAAELRLARCHRVRGVVIDSDGRRVGAKSVLMVIESALASIGRYGFAVEPELLSDGAFEFAPLGSVSDPIREKEQEFMLRVVADGFLPFAESYAPDVGRAGPIEIRLVRPGNVRGRCVDRDGHGLPGVRVEASRSSVSLGAPIVSAADGRFEFAGLAQTGGAFVLTATGLASADVAVPAFDPGTGIDVGDVVLPAGETLRGRVVSADGTPVADAGVWASLSRTAHPAAQSRTDREGRFALDHIPSPPWRIYVQESSSGLSPDEQRNARMAWAHFDVHPDGELVIELHAERLVRIDVQLAPGEGSAPDPRLIQATLRRKGGEVLQREPDPQNRPAGSFRWRLAEGGYYEAVIAMNGYETVTLPMDSYASGETSFRVLLKRLSR